MMRGFLAPRSWLLPAAALVALVFAVFLTADTTPAQAQQVTQSRFQVWNSTLTIGAGNTWRGYDGNVGGLPNPSFIFDGVTYEIERLSVTNGDKTLQFVLDKAIPDRLKSSLKLRVGYTEFTLANATLSNLGGVTNDTVTWPNIRQDWPTAGYNRPVGLTAADLWSATLTAGDLGSGAIFGCDQTVTGAECSTGLTDNSFTYAGADYQISALSVNPSSGLLVLTLDKTIPDSLDKLVLHVNGQRFGSSIGEKATVVNTDDAREWSETGLSWSANDTVKLRLTERQRQLSFVSFTLASHVMTEIYIIDGERSIEKIPVRIEPPLDSESEIMLRIKDHCAGSSHPRIATQFADYIMQLPNAADSSDTKLLRLPEGVGQVIILIRAVADRKNEGEEATCFELVPIKDAPYILRDSHSESVYPETEFVILDNSIAAPDEADPRRGINVQPTSAGFTEGSSITYTVELRSRPRGNVKIFARVLGSNHPPIHTSPSSVIFTPDRWFERKTFTVTAPLGDYGGSFGTGYIITHALRTDPVDENYDSSYWFHGPGIDGQKHILIRVKDVEEVNGGMEEDPGGTEGGLGVVPRPPQTPPEEEAPQGQQGPPSQEPANQQPENQQQPNQQPQVEVEEEQQAPEYQPASQEPAGPPEQEQEQRLPDNSGGAGGSTGRAAPVVVAHYVAPLGALAFSESTVATGQTITVTGTGFVGWTPVQSVTVGGLEAFAGGWVITDPEGKFTVDVMVPGLSPGRQPVVATVGGWTASSYLFIDPDAVVDTATPVAQAWAGVAVPGLVVWHFDNESQKWSFYDPALPEFSDLEFMETGQVYLVQVGATTAATLNGQLRSLTCVNGNCWNVILW